MAEKCQNRCVVPVVHEIFPVGKRSHKLISVENTVLSLKKKKEHLKPSVHLPILMAASRSLRASLIGACFASDAGGACMGEEERDAPAAGGPGGGGGGPGGGGAVTTSPPAGGG